MGIFGKKTTVKTSEVAVDEKLAGKSDPMFQLLISQTLEGEVQLYQCNIPADNILPFDKTVDALNTYIGKDIFNQIKEKFDKTQSIQGDPSIFVYPKDGNYIASDDYMFLSIYKKLGVQNIPAIVFGLPSYGYEKQIAGPAPLVQAKKALLGG